MALLSRKPDAITNKHKPSQIDQGIVKIPQVYQYAKSKQELHLYGYI